ncbi:adenylyl-sulfate kinase [Microbacterium sp. bgisy189]|uniref:adenylyl-sulfate kinase n=1 Tax=Microbacterium sp. bgisy189 TaxID=3413798 RepID=UPI003EBF077E
MTIGTLALEGSRLEGLELILSGLVHPVAEYVLPEHGGATAAPMLRVPPDLVDSVERGGELTLTDRDNTPLAVLTVTGASLGVDSAWLAGPLRGVRAAEHGIGRHRRMRRETDLEGRVAVIVSEACAADVLRAVAFAEGRPIDFVLAGGPDAVVSGKALADLEACIEQLPDARVWFVPDTDLGTPEIDAVSLLTDSRRPAEVVDLRRPVSSPSRGAVLLFTGLSGAGKSTIARAVSQHLAARGLHRPVLLDGDNVRHELSSELGFSREDRDKNVQRIAWVAARVAEGGGLAICAPIAPFAASREAMRTKVEPNAPFLVIHVATPLHIAEGRDRKGLYAKARAGLLTDFTGIDSPYEAPVDPALRIDTSTLSVEECVERVERMLREKSLVSGS